MSNLVTRNMPWRGHLINQIPNHFVCAECGGNLVVKYGSPTMDDVQCVKSEKHQGMVKRSQQAHNQAQLRQQTTVLKVKEAQAIAQTSPEVRELLHLRNEQSKQELF